MKANATLDAIGLYCPMPIYHTAKKMKELKAEGCRRRCRRRCEELQAPLRGVARYEAKQYEAKQNEAKRSNHDVLEVLADDEGIKEDMPAWCRSTGNEFIGIEEDDGQYRVYVRKTKD